MKIRTKYTFNSNNF